MAVTVASSHWFTRLLNTVFTVLVVGMTALFWIALLSPGNEHTGWFFSLISPVTAILQQVYDCIGYPVRWVCAWIAGFLPDAWLAFFPTTTVKTLVTGFLNLFSFVPGFVQHPITQSFYHWEYDKWFPGVIDWQILLTIRMLTFIEDLITPKTTVFSSKKLQNMIEANRWNFLDEWGQNQPFTPDTLPGAVSQDALMAPPADEMFPELQNSASSSQKVYQSNPIGLSGMSMDARVRPMTPPPAYPGQQPAVQPGILDPANDPETGLMGRQAFSILMQTQLNWAEKHDRPIGIIWLELATLSVAPPSTLNQLGRWLSNLTTKEGRLVPARYGAHSIAVLAVNQTPEQAQQVANHLQQRLNEFHFAPLVGMSHSNTLPSPVTSTVLLQTAYQQALQQPAVRAMAGSAV